MRHRNRYALDVTKSRNHPWRGLVAAILLGAMLGAFVSFFFEGSFGAETSTLFGIIVGTLAAIVGFAIGREVRR